MGSREEAVSDPSKATLNGWVAESVSSDPRDDPRWLVKAPNGEIRFLTVGDDDEKNAKLFVQAINSYNPERDKAALELTQELNRQVEFVLNHNQSKDYIQIGWLLNIRDAVRKLLKLYEEAKA
jgi:hypothetical protein